MLKPEELEAIDVLWVRKLEQDRAGLPLSERHRNLEPSSAEFINALAAAARSTGGKLISIEIEAGRQGEARATIASLGLAAQVEFLPGDAGELLPGLGAMSFALIDCEKEDYIPFFDLLESSPGLVVVADNILSHELSAYVDHVRGRPGVESLTLPIGKGLEVTRFM